MFCRAFGLFVTLTSLDVIALGCGTGAANPGTQDSGIEGGAGDGSSVDAGTATAAFDGSGADSSSGGGADGGGGGGGGGADGGGDSAAEGGGPCIPGGTAGAGAIEVELCTVNQTIDGFGAADVFSGTPLTTESTGGNPAQVTLFFDPVNGIGLSLLRIGIQDDTGTGTVGLLGGAAYADAKAAGAFGVTVWAAPWSPPAKYKISGETDGVATTADNVLISTDYTAWATEIAAFPATFKQNTGMDLYAISAQNEPDFNATTYASCLYSSSQMVTFVNDLGPLLAALKPPVKMLAAEPDSWDNLWSNDDYGPAILAGANSSVNILATHDYGHKAPGDLTSTRPAPPAGTTQHIWETEMSDETTPDDLTITQGIQTAVWVYAAITTGGANAWHYWWLINANWPRT